MGRSYTATAAAPRAAGGASRRYLPRSLPARSRFRVGIPASFSWRASLFSVLPPVRRQLRPNSAALNCVKRPRLRLGGSAPRRRAVTAQLHRTSSPEQRSAWLRTSTTLADESGATAIEYSLIAAGISITIILSTAGGQLPVQRMPRYALQPAISSATSTKSAGLVEC